MRSRLYGDLYQWGRLADGHQRRTSQTTATLSTSDTPGDGSFILVSNAPVDWRTPQNDNLWQGVTGINNPSPSGFRLPTEVEFVAEHDSWSSQNYTGGFTSPLKLVPAGYRNYEGTLSNAGSLGYYWSSTVNGSFNYNLNFSSSTISMGSYFRAVGFSVRCIKD